MSDTVSSGQRSPSSSEDLGLGVVGYILLFLAPFTLGMTALAGVGLAYARRPLVSSVPRSHYVFQISIFWTSLITLILSAVALLGAATGYFGESVDGTDVLFPLPAVAGLVLLCLAPMWTMAASAFGAFRLLSERPIGVRP